MIALWSANIRKLAKDHKGYGSAATSIHKERSFSVSRRLLQFTVDKNVIEFLNDIKFTLYLKYDIFSTTWCMTRIPTCVANYLRQSSFI
jgi:hypothetical protein